MYLRILLQGLTLLVLMQTLLYLVFRMYSESDQQCISSSRPKEKSEVHCEKCRFNFTLDLKEIELIKLKGLDFTELSGYNTFISNQSKTISNKNVLIGLKDLKSSLSNIFFVETRCGTNKLTKEFNNSFDFILSARQSCAVESTARKNPDRDVYIVHTCPLSDDFLSRAPEYARNLLELRNVYVVRVNLAELFQDSPVQQLFESGRLDESNWPVIHASDVIRILLLWNFGGTHCDLDIINIRPFDQLGTNFAGYEDIVGTINNAVLNLEFSGLGRKVSTKVLYYLNSHFDGKQWAANGPNAIKKVVVEVCEADAECIENADTFTVFDPIVFYPVYYPGYQKFFDATISTDLIKLIKSSSFVVHFWNQLSQDMVVQVGSNQTYALLAEEFCPGVYANCGTMF